ncbi:sodium-translocating pyrophosphatase [Spirochaeta africana]|nr:sodium-translocating pyrophosphatase [Spirochaeta africana]
MITTTFLIAGVGGGVAALVFALFKTRWIYRQSPGSEDLQRISGYVSEGAMAFLSREYRVLIPFVIIVAAFLAVANTGSLRLQSIAFLLGALTSGLAGFIGMRVATASNSRTTHAATNGLNPALKVAFSGGTVMGMSVVGLVLLGASSILIAGSWLYGDDPDTIQYTILPILSGFSLGASSIALFSRVGGGIFTKAADVGADLVGKVEAGIPEDDPRNPATIADNVGDNVGDVAGMGADLFESFVGSLVGSMILALTVDAPVDMRLRLFAFPIILSAVGLLSSMIGVFFVRAREGISPQKALNAGTFGASLLAALLTILTAYLLVGGQSFAGAGMWHLVGSVLIGLVAGVSIGLLTEMFTGTDTYPVNQIVESCQTGAATTIITGVGMGMLSTVFPILIIGATILISFMLTGLFGIAIAALGMLITLGIQLAVDAYGPIADNAGGLAVMAGYPAGVRDITDELDSVGNTTAAIGKGFAIGSAALTAIILFTSFREQAGAGDINLMDVRVLVGILLGAVIPYLFSALAMNAIGKAAFLMIEEVRRQFKQKPGILTDTEKPDYGRCVDISTASALKQMLIPGIIAALTPVLVGFLGGIDMLVGVLVGVTASGVVLAIFMANSGGAWDNAKKMIEGGAGGGRGSEAHKASVVGDTVGDPFKDTAGPALNILIKLMAVVSLVIAPMLMAYWG